MSGSYSYRPTWQMAAGLVLIVGLIWLLRGRAWTGRSGPRARAACLLAGLLCLVPVVQPERLGAFGVETDVWDQAGAYRSRRGPGGLSAEHGIYAGGGAWRT